MIMHSFLLDHPPGDAVSLPPDQAHHALRVLRAQVGDEARLTDGKGGLWRARIASVEGGQVLCQIIEALPGGESPVRVTLYQGLPKADKLELIAQKATELGAVGLLPVAMARSVSRWEEREAPKKLERLSRIAQEAIKQCGRAQAPAVGPLLTWNQALARMAAHDLMLMPWEQARDTRLHQIYAQHPQALDIGILIGPEGGITGQEAGQAMDRGALPVTLGPRILRLETAAICACALVQQLWGDI